MITEDSPLHKEIGRTVARLDLPNTKVILDKLCGGDQTIQLFCGPLASRGSRLCQVDIAVLLNNDVKAIVEIEESSHKPVQICGKVLVSALATHFIHEGTVYKKAERIFFIQVVGTGSEGLIEAGDDGVAPIVYLPPDRERLTSRLEQLRFLEPAIQKLIDPSGTHFQYDIFPGSWRQFSSDNHKEELLAHLRRAITGGI